MEVLLTIAGFDPSGGAGVQRDLEVFFNGGWKAKSVLTSITFQDGKRVTGRYDLSEDTVKRQLENVSRYGRIRGIKIGMLGTLETVETVYEFLKGKRGVKVVLDPVLYSSDGFPLLNRNAYSSLLNLLFPLCTVVTPNRSEAMRLSGKKDLHSAGKFLLKYAKNVLITGGDEDGNDILFTPNGRFLIKGKRIPASIHGSGCMHSSSLLLYLLKGLSLPDAARMAKRYVEKKIKKEVLHGI